MSKFDVHLRIIREEVSLIRMAFPSGLAMNRYVHRKKDCCHERKNLTRIAVKARSPARSASLSASLMTNPLPPAAPAPSRRPVPNSPSPI